MLNDLGEALRQSGHAAQAVRCYGEAAALRPDWIPPANNLAWTLAVFATNDPRRAAGRAVEIASRICQSQNLSDPATLDTLAAAYAAAGRFDDAIATIEKALRLLPADVNNDLRRAMLARQQLYEAGQPYRVAAGADR